MKFSQILREGAADEFKQKFRQKFTPEQLQKFVDSVPTKFLEWSGKIFDPTNFDSNFEVLVNSLNKFNKISTNLPLTDINSYKSFDQLVKSLSDYENRPRREYKQVEGGNIVYDDGRYFVVNPLTHTSSCYYGRGTKWCTSSELPERFEQYNNDGKLFYILDRQLPTSDDNYKVAILQKFEGDRSFWDAKDNQKESKWFPKLNMKSQEILDAIDGYLESNFAEQLKLWRDKEAAKKERERFERLRIQREIDRFQAEAQLRREEGEWDLTNPNIDEEGIFANAVLNYIDDYNSNFNILTDQDKLKISEINSEIARLNREYDESENTNTELLDKIEELEDELSSIYEDSIDVYSLVPYGEYYDLQKFVIASDPFGQAWVAGYENQVQEAAEEYVRQLIDDVGYDRFREGFIENFLDEDAIEESFREMYYYDVNDEPDVYLNDEDRELSVGQKERISVLKERIDSYKEKISQLESHSDEVEDEKILTSIEVAIENFELEIEEFEEEIEEIESSPEGDFPQDKIDDAIENMVADKMRDPLSSLKEYDWIIEEYIDKDKLIKGVVDEDGYGTMNSYDGDYDGYRVLDKYVIVMRIE